MGHMKSMAFRGRGTPCETRLASNEVRSQSWGFRENFSHIGSCIDQRIEEQGKRPVLAVLLLVEWNLRQDRRLDYVFGFFCFLG